MSSIPDQYEEEGFVVSRSALDLNRISNLRQEFLGEAELPPDATSWDLSQRLHERRNLWNRLEGRNSKHHKSDALFDLMRDPFLLSVAKEILGEEVRISHEFNHRVRWEKEVRTRVPPHQDSIYVEMPESQVNRDMRSLICWIPLFDVKPPCSTMSVIPKSHTSGRLRHIYDLKYPHQVCDCDESRMVDLEFEVGDVLFMSPFLVHGSTPHRGDRARISIDFRFSDMLGDGGNPWFPGIRVLSSENPQGVEEDKNNWWNLINGPKEKWVND